MPDLSVESTAQVSRGIRSLQGSLPGSARIGRVRLAVSSLQASLQFYRDVIGLRPIGTETHSEGAPLIRLGTPDGTVLLELQQLPQGRPIGHRTRLGLYHTALLLPSRADLGSLTTHLDEIGFRYGSSDHLVSEALYLVDPDGLTVEVYADRPRSEWRYEDGMIVSGVFPLDKPGLKRAASSAWTGIPNSTTMGHIHFYVADLKRSSDFYHHGMGLDIVMQVPGALFASTGGYHHQVGYNVFAAGSPAATADDPRVLFWELMVPNEKILGDLTARLQAIATSTDLSNYDAPAFVDEDGIRVALRAERQILEWMEYE